VAPGCPLSPSGSAAAARESVALRDAACASPPGTQGPLTRPSPSTGSTQTYRDAETGVATGLDDGGEAANNEAGWPELTEDYFRDVSERRLWPLWFAIKCGAHVKTDEEKKRERERQLEREERNRKERQEQYRARDRRRDETRQRMMDEHERKRERDKDREMMDEQHKQLIHAIENIAKDSTNENTPVRKVKKTKQPSESLEKFIARRNASPRVHEQDPVNDAFIEEMAKRREEERKKIEEEKRGEKLKEFLLWIMKFMIIFLIGFWVYVNFFAHPK